MNHDRPWKPRWFDAVSIAIVIIVLLLAVAAKLEAAVHEVAPGASVQAAIDAAEAGDVVRLQPGQWTGQRVEIRKPLTLECAEHRACNWDGEHALDNAIIVWADNVWIVGIAFQRYISGISIRGGNIRPSQDPGEGVRNVVILHSTFARIGARWGCPEDYPQQCKGYGAITAQNADYVIVMHNRFRDVVDSEEPGGNHCMYFSNHSQWGVFTHNDCENVSGSPVKFRDRSDYGYVGFNRIARAGTALYSGVANACYDSITNARVDCDAPTAVAEVPDEDIWVEGNRFVDIDRRQGCKLVPYGSITSGNCAGIFVSSWDDEPEPPSQVLRCRSGKHHSDVRNWDRSDCRRCTEEGSEIRNQCNACVRSNSRRNRNRCVRALFP